MMIVARQAEPVPMSALNTTPLIDVMLVLLIMFIITIPPQSDAVKFDLPGGPPPIVEVNPIRNRLVVTEGGAILWNGAAVSKAELGRALAASQLMSPVPELHLQPEDEARYETVDEVLAMTKLAQVRKVGFVGNERFAAAF